jgi:two-component system nitrogen regulation sensor histidine kinase NtrY
MANCDGRLIAQAIGNLLKNSAESISARSAADSEKGRIRVAVAVVDGQARISVADNGVGLPKAERHRLTEPYMTTRIKGTGLGLAIVKKVIEEHGGALFFEDCADLGSGGAIVSVTLPLAASGREAAPAAAE